MTGPKLWLWHTIDAVTEWLTPARRQAIYAALGALGVILVAIGYATESAVTGWVGLVDAVLSFAALILASIKARKVAWTALYAAGALVVGSLKVLGFVNDGQEAHILNLMAAGAAAAPLLIAAVRTSSKTPTGEPVAEYAARHGQG